MTPSSQSVQAHFEHDSDEIEDFIQDTERTIASYFIHGSGKGKIIARPRWEPQQYKG